MQDPLAPVAGKLIDADNESQAAVPIFNAAAFPAYSRDRRQILRLRMSLFGNRYPLFRDNAPTGRKLMPANLKFSNPSTIAKPPGYTHVVEATGPNRLIYIAGQLGLDLDNKLVGPPGDFRAQATKAFENLKAALAGIGADMKNVVKINNYLTDMSHIGTFREVRDQFVNTEAAPAST